MQWRIKQFCSKVELKYSLLNRGYYNIVLCLVKVACVALCTFGMYLHQINCGFSTIVEALDAFSTIVEALDAL